MADAGVPVWDGVQGEMAEDGGQKNWNLSSGDDLGQGYAGNDVDGGEQGVLGAGFGQSPDKGVDAGWINLSGPFQCGANDEAGGLGQKLVKVFEGGAAADEERGTGGSGVGAAKMVGIGAMAGAGAAQDEGIGATTLPSVAGLVLDGVSGGHRGGVFDIHIGKDADMTGPDPFAETKEFFSDAVEDALVGQASADEDVHADEVGPRGGGHGHGADPVVAEEVDAEGAGKELAGLAGEGGETGNGGGAGGVGGEGRVAEIFDDDGVSAALFQSQKVATHGLPDEIEFSAVAGCAGKCAQMNHAKQAFL